MGVNMSAQLDLFEDNSDIAVLTRKILNLEESQGKVRRKQFAEIQLLSKICFEQADKIEKLEKLIQDSLSAK